MNKNRIAALAMAAAVAATSTAPALAAGMTYQGASGRTDVYFEKFLTMDKEANVPNVTFTYSITGGAAQTAAQNNAGQVTRLQVYSGSDSTKVDGTPQVNTNAVFAPGDETFTTVQDVPTEIASQKKSDGSTVDKDNVVLDATKKYARKNLSISFGNVRFKEPGVYRYIITENIYNNDRAHGITMDGDATRIMDVYVIHDDESNECKVEGYVLHNNEADAVVSPSGAGTEGKADGFANDYETENLTIEKQVAGNQGSRDEYFQFTLNISNAISGTVYSVDLTNADPTTEMNAINGESHNNPSTITADDNGNATATFWLQHGQSVQVNGLARGTFYTINEDSALLKNEGYRVQVESENMEPAGSKKQADTDAIKAADVVTDTQTGLTADTKMLYTNTKEGIIPTGIVTPDIIGAAVLTAGTGLGLATLARKMKKDEKDEDEAED